MKNDGTASACGDNGYGELGNGTNNSSNVHVQVAGLCPMALGIQEMTEPITFSVFPNPADNAFEILNLKFEIKEIAIYDFLGAMVFQSQINNLKSHITVDVSRLNAGMYFLQIQTSDFLQARKIVIAR